MVITTAANGQCIVADYPFNGNANDISGNGLHGMVNGASLTMDRFGSPNGAYQFDGVDDYIVVPDTNLLDFDFSEDFSVAAWVRIPPTQNHTTGSTRNIIVIKWKVVGVNPDPYAYTLSVMNQTAATPGGVRAVKHDRTCNNTPINESAVTINDSTFHHAVYVRDGSKLKLYIDGNLDTTVTDITTCTTINGDSLYIGRRGGNVDYEWLTGIIDEVQIYDCALDPGQIDSLFNYTPAGINEIANNNELTIYPNPSTGLFTVEGTVTDILVYDLYGRLVLRTNKKEIDMSDKPKGVYIVQVGEITRKLVLH